MSVVDFVRTFFRLGPICTFCPQPPTLSPQPRLSATHSHPPSLHSRSKDIIEPLQLPQWFCNCTTMAARAVAAVRTGELRLIPDTFEKTWFHWLENIKCGCVCGCVFCVCVCVCVCVCHSHHEPWVSFASLPLHPILPKPWTHTHTHTYTHTGSGASRVSCGGAIRSQPTS